MTEQQQVHIGMINSFNIITERNTIYEVMSSGIGYFAHIPDREPDFETIEDMIRYFSEVEMYEKCIELTLYVEEHFNEDGTEKIESCDCDYPEFDKYDYKIVCNNCGNRIRK